MSGALAAVATAGTFALPALEASGLLPAFIRQGRSIRPTGTGTAVSAIIPDVAVEESHSDRLQITQHPVAIGSPISDHAYKLPATLTMRMGWTNANPVGAFVSGLGGGGGLAGGLQGLWSAFTETRAKEVYDTLLGLQGPKSTDDTSDGAIVPPTLLDIQTGKRKYTNMLLAELSLKTDHTTEYALIVEAHFQEVFLVQVSQTTQPAQTTMDDKAAGTADTSGKQPDPVENPNTTLQNLGNVSPFPSVGHRE